MGARLREIRKDAGLSGRALAIATGQHFTRAVKIENGAQAPTDQHNVIPGLFQTAAYTAALLSFWIGFLEECGHGRNDAAHDRG